jgi:hypothetical protein
VKGGEEGEGSLGRGREGIKKSGFYSTERQAWEGVCGILVRGMQERRIWGIPGREGGVCYYSESEG